MEISGDLQDVALLDVLQVLTVTAQTGTLAIASPGRAISLRFVGGRIGTARLRPHNRHLASVFIRQGWIDFDTLHRALVRQSRASQHQLVGQILVELGALTQAQVLAGLRTHVLGVLAEAQSWSCGKFAFSPEPADGADANQEAACSVGIGPEELAELGTKARDPEPREVPADGASWPGSPRLAVIVTDDVLVQHGLELTLEAAAYSLVRVSEIDEAHTPLLASEDPNPTLILDLDPLIDDDPVTVSYFGTLRRIQRQWPNLNVVTFGRSAPPQYVEFLRHSKVTFHMPRASPAAEERLEVVRHFLHALARVIAWGGVAELVP